MNIKNLLLMADSYKLSHWLQYPPKTETVVSYIESRGSSEWKSTLFFGLQAFLNEYLSKPICLNDIQEAKEFAAMHGVPFNEAGWFYILRKHNGLLPIRIDSVKEGTVVPTGNVLLQVRNTDPECYWLTSYVETMLLRAIWYPTTVASQSWYIKRLILSYLEKTGDPTQIGFKLHDFGARGVSSFESAGLGAMAHLVNFMGTDTITGALFAHKYYGAELPVGYSIPAAEHSTITSWGKENEALAYENMVAKFGKPGALVAVVSDSYDIFNAVTNIWGEELKEKVIASGATIVVRPDSGVPEEVVPEVIDRLMEKFGYTINDKGFKVLPSCIRVIQGDGINYNSIEKILEAMTRVRQSTDNIAFGMGGALLQGVNRDTFNFAMKCNAIYADGKWIDVFKKPVTSSMKVSKRGILALIKRNGKFETIRASDLKLGEIDYLEPKFLNGRIFSNDIFDDIRSRSNKGE